MVILGRIPAKLFIPPATRNIVASSEYRGGPAATDFESRAVFSRNLIFFNGLK
jgi:hypothetical protein